MSLNSNLKQTKMGDGEIGEKVLVESAVKLTEEEKDEVGKIFEKLLKTRITVVEHINPAILGGIKVTARTIVFDASLVNKLNKAKEIVFSD